MITKQCQFAGRDEHGQHLHILHAGYANEHLVKTASVSPPQLRHIQAFMKGVSKSDGTLYTLVSALGAGEYWGSNSNGDYFGEGPLLHVPPGWSDIPHSQQKVIGAKWEWGYPTFYNAHAFAHHQNKDPNRAFGSIEYAMWDPQMKRVLLVVGFDRERAQRFGASSVIDRVENGEFPSVSMGCFPAGTLVTMGDGTRKAIEEICVGDEVITHKGRKKKVTETHLRKYKGDLYSIKAEAHRTLRCTSEHPLLAVDRDEVKFKNGHGRWEWRRLTKDPFPVDWAHASCLRDQYLIEPVVQGYPDNNVTPRDRAFARILGYYLAEGHLLRNKKGELAGIELTANKNDSIHDEVEGLCADLGTKNPPVPRPRSNSSEAIAISIFDRKLAKAMFQWAGVYSTEKRLSEPAFLWHPSLALEMLGAYANGDGCCYEGTIKFSSSSEDLAWQLVAMLPRFGMMPSVSCIRHKAGSGFSSKDTFEWVVHVGKQWASVLAPYCQKLQPQEVFATKNSREIYHGNIVTPIRNIEALYAELDVYNLEVEEDESFLAEGLAVHNCRVPYDICSYCADWSRITLNPHIDLAEHARKPIRGLSATTDEYCVHLSSMLNKIFPDGRKVMMLNMHPRFFDLSVVFIGADKTSFILAKLASGQCPIRVNSPICKQGCTQCNTYGAVPSPHVHRVWGQGVEKTAERAERSGAVAVSIRTRTKRPFIDQNGVPSSAKELAKHYANRLSQAAQAAQKEKTAQSTGRGAWDGYLDDPAATGPNVDPDDQRKEERQVSSILKRDRSRIGRVIKVGAIPKDAEIRKQVQSNFRQNLPKIESEEPDLPVDDLDSFDLPDVLGSTGAAGVVVKPHEFQRMFIRRLGRPELADELDHKRLMFRLGGAPDDTRLGGVLPEIISKILPLIRARSAMTPSLGRRVVVAAGGTPEYDFFSMQADKGVPDRELIKSFVRYLDTRSKVQGACPGPRKQIDGPLLEKISSAYSAYRRDLMFKVAGLIKQAVYTHPEIAHSLFADDTDPRGLVKEGGDVMESMIGMLSTMYLNEAHVSTPVSSYVLEHCDLEGLRKTGGLAILGGVA